MGGAKPASRFGLLQPILALQIAFSLTVLFVGGLLLLSFQRLITVPLGFSQRGVVLFTLAAKDLQQLKQARVVASELLDRIRRFPGVQAAGMSNLGLIGGEFSPQIEPGLIIPGREHERLRSQEMSVSPGFFETMRIHLLEGRDFTARDADSESGAVIVSESFAQRYCPEGNSLGKRFHRIADDPQPAPLEIIGVVADTKYNNLRETSSSTIYEPLREIHGVTLEVRTATDPLSMTAPLREEIQTANPNVRVINVELQSTRIENTIVRERLLAILSGFFTVVAVILAATGLYGVLSYSVVRRTKEIGIRLALGAPRGSVVAHATLSMDRIGNSEGALYAGVHPGSLFRRRHGYPGRPRISADLLPAGTPFETACFGCGYHPIGNLARDGDQELASICARWCRDCSRGSILCDSGGTALVLGDH